jgi:hypothetical protein
MRKTRAATRRKCFISAPFGTDTSQLIEAFRRRDVECLRLDNLKPGAAVIDTLQKLVHDVTFVCGVFKGPSPNPNVLFELGLAAGLQKPIVVLSELDANVPLDLKSLLVVHISIDDAASIDTAIDSLLQHVTRGTPKQKSIPRNLEATIDRDAALKRLAALSGSAAAQRGIAYETFVRDLFEEANITVSQPSRMDTGADLAIWLNGIEPVIGNPILVEVKGGEATSQRQHEAETKLLQSLGKVAAPAGMIIWVGESSRPRKTATNLPIVFTFSIVELIDLLATRRLAPELVQRRNRAVHGFSP